MKAGTLLRRLPLVLVAIGLVAAAVWWIGRPKPVAVALAAIGRGKVEASIANTRAGTVEACQRTKLSTIMGGRIEVLAVKEGDRVAAGQLLMKLWNDDQQAQATLAEAQLETARKRVGEACTVIGWKIAADGRKHVAGTAIFDEDGELCARARAVWIELK